METKGISYVLGDINKKWTISKELLTAILLPSEIAVIKTEAHIKKNKPEYQGNVLADFY